MPRRQKTPEERREIADAQAERYRNKVRASGREPARYQKRPWLALICKYVDCPRGGNPFYSQDPWRKFCCRQCAQLARKPRH
jgi:hypothetical protein